MSTGYIVLGHGSKVKETVDILKNITMSLAERLGLKNISYATLQFNKPSLPEAIEAFTRNNVTNIVILPLFLVNGNHMREDIPGIIKDELVKYPSVNIRLLDHIGDDSRITDILADKIMSSLSDNGFANDVKITDPDEIEKESFRIIEAAVDFSGASSSKEAVVKRMIHASGDLSLAGLVYVSDGAIDAGIRAIRNSCRIITDVHMVATGINKKLTGIFGNEVICKIDDPVIETKSKDKRKTRSAIAMRELSGKIGDAVVVIGNAPTALFELIDMISEGVKEPALVIGTPVGFVGAAEAKEALMKSSLSCISIKGTKGGSSIAVAAANAILKLATEDVGRVKGSGSRVLG
ncbi:MAG: precorrin-8X methylmutase [Actinomycetota bacterium]|nr:precorrin-8X methylmutase [Actinomycetota bacterium]